MLTVWTEQSSAEQTDQHQDLTLPQKDCGQYILKDDAEKSRPMSVSSMYGEAFDVGCPATSTAEYLMDFGKVRLPLSFPF